MYAWLYSPCCVFLTLKNTISHCNSWSWLFVSSVRLALALVSLSSKGVSVASIAIRYHPVNVFGFVSNLVRWIASLTLTNSAWTDRSIHFALFSVLIITLALIPA
jgi:hypothetical protein